MNIAVVLGVLMILGFIVIPGIIILGNGLEIPGPIPLNSTTQVHPNDTYIQGIQDGINGTYNLTGLRGDVRVYREGYSTGYLASHCNCTGVCP